MSTLLTGGIASNKLILLGLGPLAVLATYDPNLVGSVPLYQVRLFAGDTNIGDPDFSDPELLTLLNLVQGVPQAAAATALESLATDAARLAVVTKKGTRGNDESSVHAALLLVAARLRARAPILPVVVSPPQIFVPASATGAGTMNPW